MKLLVISDIHHNHPRAQAIVDSVEHDRVVFTGDYFDTHGDFGSIEHARATAVWLKENVLYNPKATALIGNHDISYLWKDNIHFRCGGWTQFKSIAINDVLNAQDIAQFKFHHIDQGFLFSHAGLSNTIWKQLRLRHPDRDDQTPLEFVNLVLTYILEEAVEFANCGHPHVLFEAGWDRGGRQHHGGILWGDWSNFAPINGVNQIFGHSHRRLPEILTQKEGGAISKKNILEHYDFVRICREADSYCPVPLPTKKILSTNYDLDTGLNHYTVITDGDVNIYDFFNRLNLKEVGNLAIPDSNLHNLS